MAIPAENSAKIFPADVLGASFVRGFLAPLGDGRLASTDGLTTDLAIEFILEAGMRAERQAGLARALFAVCLSQLDNAGTPVEHLSFLVGAVLAADLDALTNRGVFVRNKKVMITSGGAVALTWQHALELSQISAQIVFGSALENAYLASLRRICGL